MNQRHKVYVFPLYLLQPKSCSLQLAPTNKFKINSTFTELTLLVMWGGYYDHILCLTLITQLKHRNELSILIDFLSMSFTVILKKS